MKTLQEKIAVMQHYANGGAIEMYFGGEWRKMVPGQDTTPVFNWQSYDYRIAKENKVGWILIAKADSVDRGTGEMDDPDYKYRYCSIIYYDKSHFNEEELKRVIKVEWEE